MTANRADFGGKKVSGLFEDFEEKMGGHADFGSQFFSATHTD